MHLSMSSLTPPTQASIGGKFYNNYLSLPFPIFTITKSISVQKPLPCPGVGDDNDGRTTVK